MNLQQLFGQLNAEPADTKTPPRALRYSLWALGGTAVFLIVSALLRFGFTSEISKQLIDANKDAKKPKSPYGPAQVAHDLHSIRIAGLIEAVIFAAVLALIGWQMIQGKGFMRWLLLGIAVLTRLPLYVLLVGGTGSVLIRLSAFLTGLTYIVALLLIFVPRPARNFFLAHRNPATAGGGLASIFGPKRPAAGSGAPTSGSVTLNKRPAEPSASSAPRSKAKSRVTEAVDAPAARPSGRGKSRGR